MEEIFERTQLLIGEHSVSKLAQSSVIVFGVGGVGGYACEILARSGVGRITIVDKDVITLSNINRQIIALHSTVGKLKTDVMKTRIEDINSNCKVTVFPIFYLPATAGSIPLNGYDYIIDAIDNVTAKLYLIEKATEENIPIISCMGAGNKLDPTAFHVADIFKTQECPLARVMRRELKARGIARLKCVYSSERASEKDCGAEVVKDISKSEKPPVASISFTPAIAGILLASEVVKDIIKDK